MVLRLWVQTPPVQMCCNLEQDSLLPIDSPKVAFTQGNEYVEYLKDLSSAEVCLFVVVTQLISQ